MTERLRSGPSQPQEALPEAETLPCGCCGRDLTYDQWFLLQGERWCLRCALLFGPVGRRSLKVALVVGTALTAINQGNLLLAGQVTPDLWWKIPLTYCVPFCVASYSALSSSRA